MAQSQLLVARLGLGMVRYRPGTPLEGVVPFCPVVLMRCNVWPSRPLSVTVVV